MNTFLAVFGIGDEELLLACAAMLILFGAKKIPNFAKGLGQGIREFRNAAQSVTRELDEAGFDAGRNLGGIHGKAAFAALTTDNQNVELSAPIVFRHAGQINTLPEEKMKKFFQPNIGRSGRLLRGIGAAGIFIGACFVFRVSIWGGILMLCLGAFMLFEALRGWCGLRACGIKTKL